jgi:hypothetical protein
VRRRRRRRRRESERIKIMWMEGKGREGKKERWITGEGCAENRTAQVEQRIIEITYRSPKDWLCRRRNKSVLYYKNSTSDYHRAQHIAA